MRFKYNIYIKIVHTGNGNICIILQVKVVKPSTNISLFSLQLKIASAVNKRNPISANVAHTQIKVQTDGDKHFFSNPQTRRCWSVLISMLRALFNDKLLVLSAALKVTLFN